VFLFRNGTDDGEELMEYPLFGRANSETDMLWTDFLTLMQGIGVGSVENWCEKCANTNTFCLAFSDIDSKNSKFTSSHYSSVSPVLAGLIGAIVTIAMIALLAFLAALLGGIRIRKSDNKRMMMRSRGSLGGFKGAEKLSSDRDLERTAKGVVRERLGSWELKGKKDEGEGGERDLGEGMGEGNWDERGPDDDGIMDGVKPVVVEDRV